MVQRAISKIELKNFLCYDYVEVCPGPINFFIGPNGGGKTTISERATKACLGGGSFTEKDIKIGETSGKVLIEFNDGTWVSRHRSEQGTVIGCFDGVKEYTFNGIKDAQPFIKSIFGFQKLELDFGEVDANWLKSQHIGFFLSGNSASLLEKIYSAFGVGEIAVVKKSLKSNINKLEILIETKNSEMSSLKARVNELEEKLSLVRLKISQANISNLILKVDSVINKLKFIKPQIQVERVNNLLALYTKVTQVINKLKTKKSLIETIDYSLYKRVLKIEKAVRLIQTLTSKISTLQSELNEYPQCPTCQQYYAR